MPKCDDICIVTPDAHVCKRVKRGIEKCPKNKTYFIDSPINLTPL